MPEAGKPPVEIRGHDIAVVSVIGSIGLVMSALIGMATPALYYTFAIRAERQALEIETAYTAKAVQSIIFSRLEMWEFETIRLLEVASKRTVNDGEDERTLYDASGNIVIETKFKAPAPIITSTAPIFVSGDKVGAVRAKRSVGDIMWGTIFAGIFGSAFGLGVYLLFRSYPLRLLKEALTGLASEKEKTETTLSSIRDGVITVDREARIIYMNPVAEMWTGWRSGEALGHNLKECYVTRRESERMESEGYTTCTLLSRNGDPQTIEEGWSPIKGRNSSEDGHVIVFRDVAEKRNLERQVQQAQKLESLGVLAGGIAHDFNNILMAVLGHAELALEKISPMSPARGDLTDIATAARHAADLCRQMLAYAGKSSFALERVGLRDLVEEMAHLLKTSISKKAILNLNLERGLPPIQADPSQVRQIAMNLIINASEAIGDQSGVITVSVGATRCDEEYLRKTELREDLVPGLYVHLEVTDTGGGMGAETRSRIFDPFFSTKFTGRGLGLAAVLGIVRAHKGALKVYSEPGKGTTFKILFPVFEDTVVPESRQAVLEGFCDVGKARPALGGEVGDRPRHAARLSDRPSRQGETICRPREERGRFRRELPQQFRRRRADGTVRPGNAPRVPRLLDRPAGVDPAPDRRGRFAARIAGPRFDRDRKHGDREVDPVEEGSGKLSREPVEERRGAPADLPGVARVAARARVGRRQQQEPAREPVPMSGSRDPDLSRLDRLPERLPDLGAEFGEFVEEKHTAVGEGDLARPGRVPSAQQTGRGDRRVRRPERPAEERAGPRRFPGSSVDARRVQDLRRREVGEDSGKALGEHRLSAPWGPHEEHRVAPRRRDLEGPARHRLTDHVREIVSALGRGGAGPFRLALPGIRAGAIVGRFLARESGGRLAEGTDSDHPDPGHQARFVPVVEGGDDPRDSKVPREDRLGEGPPDRTNRAVERELPRDDPPGQRFPRQDTFRGQHRESDRKIEKGAVLPQIGRREVDGYLPAGEGESGVAHGGPDPVVAFPDRSSGEPNDGVGGQPVGDIGLDFHGNRVDPEHGEGQGANEQAKGPPGGTRSDRAERIYGEGEQPACRGIPHRSSIV